MSGFVCLACGYDNLFEKPWDNQSPSDEICPSCGIHFGYDDVAGGDIAARDAVYARWRERWKSAGCPWFSVGRAAPANWDPAVQLRRVVDG